MGPLSKVSDSIYAQDDGESVGNVGMIVTDSGNYLIDTSMFPVLGREIRKQAESLGIGKINGVFLTHTHFDHMGGMQHFDDVPSYAHTLLDKNFRERYMHEEFIEKINKRDDKHKFEDLKPTAPSKLFQQNPFIPEDTDQIEMFWTGGHTSGSAFVYYRKDNVLFTGDNLFAEVFPWGGDPTSDPYAWVKSIDVMKGFNPSVIIPGHGEVQHSLKEFSNLKNLLQQVIETGEKLVSEGVNDETALKSLMDIDTAEESWKDMKKNTMTQWYGVIKEKSSQ